MKISKQKLRLKKRSKQKIIALAFMGMGILTIIIMFFMLVNKSDAPAPRAGDSFSSERENNDENPNITILATGDWIAHDAINAEAKKSGSYDYSSMTSMFKPVFSQSDINFCNLATMAAGERFGISGYPSFNAPLEWNDNMANLGCNVINTGTNHTNDKGQAVIDANLNHLDSLNNLLAVAGANRNQVEQNEVKYFESKGVKFAFVSYSTYSNSPNPNPYSLNRFDEPLVTKQMNEARQQADIVIASMRWGTEYSDTVNASQKQAASKLADLGADIVLGHGTHTLQAVEKIQGQSGRETLVWYGLGNFLNAQLEVGGLTGCIAKISIDTTSKRVSSNECLPFYQHYEWSASDKASERLMARSNFKIMPLYEAQEYISKSQLDTTIEEQMQRIKNATNSLTEVKVINAND